MIKHNMPKPLVFDKVKFFKNLNNWVHVEDEWGGFDYEGDGTSYYEFNVDYTVGDDTVSVWVEVCHTWDEHHDPGDYWNPPSSDVYNEDVDVYISQIYVNDMDVDMEPISDLINRLEFLIQDTIVDY